MPSQSLQKTLKHLCSIISSISVLSLALILFTAAPLHSQEFRGSITGVVSDSTGGALPNAVVIVQNMDTQASFRTHTSSNGSYFAPSLAPGRYQIHIEAPNFKSFEQVGIILEASDNPQVNVTLQIGDVSQQVVVNADAPIVDASNAAISQVITTREVEDLPQNGRTPAVLAQLGVGVSSTNRPGQTRPFDNAGAAAIAIAGTHDESTEILLDGSPDTDNLLKLAYSPPQDIVQSVSVSAFQLDAAYGHSGGGVLNQITKSGTNTFHGSLYEYAQFAALNANGYFADRTNTPKANTHYNQYGLSIGGPVRIPRLFNGHDKVFFEFAWEGIRDAQPATGFLTVPTDAERTGDFSALLNAGPQYQIYDPATAKIAGGIVTRQPFKGNIIPKGSINPIAAELMKFYPEPNTPSAGADGVHNYFTSFPSRDLYDNQFGRLDFNIGSRDRLFLDMRHSQRTQTTNNYFNNISTGDPLDRVNWGSGIDNVYTINSTTMVNTRVNWNRYVNYALAGSQGLDPTAIGYSNNLIANTTLLEYPSIQFSGCNSGSSTTFACLFDPNNLAASTYTESYHLLNTVTKVLHQHQLKMGVDARQYRVANISYNYSTGKFSFGNNFTQASSTAAAAPLGQDLAALLLGLPTSGEYDNNVFISTHSNYLALFLQDDWKIKRTLTLNLGLRFDHDFPLYERHNRAINGFDPTTITPLTGSAVSAYNAHPIPQVPTGQFNVLGGVTFANPAQPQLYNAPSKTFSPRVGFAWSPDYLQNKTVLAGGFSIFVFPLLDVGTLNSSGFSSVTPYVATNNNYVTSAADLNNPFPNGFIPPTGASLGASTYQGQEIYWFNKDFHNAYSERWSLSMQHEFGANTFMQVAYIGAHYVKLPVTQDLNFIPSQYLSTKATRDANVIALLNGAVANPFSGLLSGTTLNGTTIARSQLLLPYPQYPQDQVLVQNISNGNRSYNSLNVRVQHRLSHGFSMMANYTWSKSIEQNSLLNPSDTSYEKHVSTEDYPHHLVISSTYKLPYASVGGDGFVGHLKHALLGGWAASGTYLLQSGPPLSWGNVVYLGGPLNVHTRETNKPAFDVTQFDRNSADQPADNIRTFHTTDGRWRGDKTNNLDASLARQVSYRDRITGELRIEAFNLFNHPVFSNPNLTPTSSSFGLITSQAGESRTMQVSAHVRF
jgi:hypothetical protein